MIVDFDTATQSANGAPQTGKIEGSAAAAILLMLLDESDAAAILKHLDPTEIRALGKAMFATSSASEAQIDNALGRFVKSSQSVSSLASGAEPRIRKVMHEALGNVRADNILASIAPQSSAAALDILRWMDVPVIAKILSTEHPQVGAIILSVLTPPVAAEVLEGFDDAHQADLVMRAARLSSVSGDAIADLEAIMANATGGMSALPKMTFGGTSEAAKIFNNMKKGNMERVLKSVRKQDKRLGQEIEDEMFIFDNLNSLDAKGLGTVLRSVDASVLALALKGASPELSEKMLGAMSARAAESIRDDMAESGLVKRAEVDEAQKSIIAVARKLSDAGEIMMGSKGEDYV
jgi:flagellar motor switch protein FliG